nr:broad-complex core protein [Exorista sorbillans]
MDDEFKLCWKNFQDNIASGFQSLYDRGDLVDVTLACDGKLLQAHKFVLAICSPYFQEIFITNPCKHPIIILKDVSYNIMCELMEFMYQGVVNVKHTELQTFMKIGQLLQIKGLATNNSSSATSTSSEKSLGTNKRNDENDEIAIKPFHSPANETTKNEENSNTDTEKPNKNSPNTPQRSQSPLLSPVTSPMENSSKSIISHHANKFIDSQPTQHQLSSHENIGTAVHKRHSDYGSDSLSIYSRSKHRRSMTSTEQSSDNTENPDSGSVSGAIEQMNTDDFFLPHISMVESRYDINNVKRENSEHHQSSGVSSAAAAAAASLRNSFNNAAFGLDYTFYKNSNISSQANQEYPNDLHMSNEYSKSFANHMDIPPNCPNVVMLSSTSLLHGSCVFNRNNTVATQQGMKTYWLCKSYRISMCRARCITHQGKIISATGVHNHPPHMRGNSTTSNNNGSNGNGGPTSAGNNAIPPSSTQTGSSSASNSFRFSQNNNSSGNNNQHGYHDHHRPATSPLPPSMISANPHLHSGQSNNNVNPTSHLFVQSMPNLLVQHYPSSQSTHLLQQSSFPTQSSSSFHNYEMTTAMQTSPSNDHSRNQSTFDPHEKNLDALSKDHLTNEHIPVHNAAALSPNNIANESEIDKKAEDHQVQVLDSITISPGNSHNFKMESM